MKLNKFVKNILFPNADNVPMPKRFRYISAPNNASQGKRPHYPRWLRRAIKGKNTRNINDIVKRAESQGIFLPTQVTEIQSAMRRNSK